MVSREDVDFCYEALLGRPPESEEAVAAHMAFPTRRELAAHMLQTPEFTLGQLATAVQPIDQLFKGYEPKDLEVFYRFPPFDGAGTPGFITNFLGVKVRTEFSSALGPYDGRVEGYPIPIGGVQGETAEFIGTLRSVLSASKRFTILECGAGYGPWMGISAAAARQVGIEELRLYGIEGDSGHFNFIPKHMSDNGLLPSEYVIIEGAVGAQDGKARWLVVDDPEAVYGGRPVTDEATDWQREENSRYKDVPIYSMTKLLQREDKWDLVHIDIQGGEAEVCRSAIDVFNSRVCRVVIGVHSRLLDAEILTIFGSAGWILENEKPTKMDWAFGVMDYDAMTLVDGVQIWRNPRLVGRPLV